MVKRGKRGKRGERANVWIGGGGGMEDSAQGEGVESGGMWDKGRQARKRDVSGRLVYIRQDHSGLGVFVQGEQRGRKKRNVQQL